MVAAALGRDPEDSSSRPAASTATGMVPTRRPLARASAAQQRKVALEGQLNTLIEKMDF